jgi:hypothetical protein
VSGTKDDFTFTGIDGSTYEMSESFIENEWYYYIKDGVHVPMDAYFYDHFNVGKVKEFTGIEVAEKWMIDREKQAEEENGKETREESTENTEDAEDAEENLKAV